MGKGKTLLICGILFFALAAAGIYGVGVYFFSGHFLPNSRLNGQNVSYQSAEHVQEGFAAGIAEYTLTLNELGGVHENIVAEQIDLKYVEDGSVEELIRAQNKWAWLLSINRSKSYTVDTMTDYSDKKLKKTVKELDCFKDMEEPADAYIDETSDGYKIVPEVQGTELDRKRVISQVRKAVEKGQQTLDLVEKKCYILPKVYRDDETLIKHAEQLNQLARAKITYDFEDRTEVVDPETIRGWLVLDENEDYQLDEGQIKEYVHQLAVKYDTYGCERDFRTAEGKMIKVKGGDYGWVLYEEEEVKALTANIKAGETVIREPEYLYRGYNREENDIGDTYVEVDLAQQRMWFYLNGSLLVDTPVVTGMPAKKHATPTGVYALDAKKSPAVLKGEGYESPVTYWMPFNKHVGIHDANWRSQFGGDIYKRDGSHGCVNTPFDMAQQIYNNIEVGMPVIVYE